MMELGLAMTAGTYLSRQVVPFVGCVKVSDCPSSFYVASADPGYHSCTAQNSLVTVVGNLASPIKSDGRGFGPACIRSLG